MRPLNNRLQVVSIELLQNLVSRGEIDEITLATIEAAVVGKLYYSVHKKRLDIQNKLLHLLHSIISASITALARTQRLSERQADPSGSRRQSFEDAPLSYAVNPLLVQTLVDGISIISNRPVYQHWLDFILMTVPQYTQALQAAIGPLNDIICRQLRVALQEVTRASQRSRGDIDNITATVTDSEFLMFLNALERLVLLGVSSTPIGSSAEDEAGPSERSGQEAGGLFGYVSTVFGSDNNPQHTSEQLSVSVPLHF
jgi:hypothetical protein